MKPIRVLAIGHAFVLAVNRATEREIAADPSFEITIAAPQSFQGDFRPLECEPEPPGSSLNVVPIPARCTGRIHVFHYSGARLDELMRSGRFDAVQAWEEPYVAVGYQIARAARKHGLAFLFRTAQNLNKRLPPPFSFFERSCLRSADRWVACGRSVYENLVERGYPADRGRVIALSVDTHLFKPAEESDRQQIRESLNLNAPIIGFLGRFTPDKGLRVLMQALERVNPSLAWNLLLLGSGELQPEIENWAAERGWSNRLRIHLARHEEVARYLAAMDLLVAPSQTMSNWKEQFGRMLIEAFACGVPVIASDSGEIPYVVGDAGIIVAEKDVAAWTHAIERLLRDPGLRSRTGAAGMARAAGFSASQVALAWRSFYRDFVGAETVPA